MTRRPLCDPLVISIPIPGPVAYQPQFGFFTRDVISRGVDQLCPSSLLLVTKTRSLSRQNVSQIIFVAAWMTGQGLPMVVLASPPSSCSRRTGVHVCPPSALVLE